MKSNITYAKPPCLLFLFFSLLIFSNSVSGQILFESSFEGNNPFAGVANNQSCCSYSATASTERAHDGSKSFRAEVRQNDPAVSSGYRSELTFPNINDQGDMWYGFSMYFEPNNSSGNDWSGCCGHVLQWHPTSSSGGAVLDIRADGGKFDICVNPAGGGSTMHQSGNLKDIVPGRWYDIVFHINWSSGADGLLEVWIDGSLYYTRQVSWTSGRYFKFGMNRWNMTNTWIVYYDNLKIGRNVTYADVAPSSSTTPPPPANQPPVANAGNDMSLSLLPALTATLNGSATDSDGTIEKYSWSRVSGPADFSFLNPLSAVTNLLGLIQGTYVFRLTVTDNDGATDTDDVTVTVNPLLPPANQSPTANAGNNVTLTLPTNSTTLRGSGSDPDGDIENYRWTRVSGPTAYTFEDDNAASTAVNGLVQGTYVFRLTVTDDDGATATDNVTVTVNPAANQSPTANAGNNVTLTLPTNSTTLRGSGSDPDGDIENYRWTRVSGPTTYTFEDNNAASTAVNGLVQGTYVFRLTVTDDDGATATDNVTVTVNPAANQSPTANAGNNITLTLPTNSTTLRGSGSDPDGDIEDYRWTRVSGPTTYTFEDNNAASTAVNGLVQGTYVFRLTVTDDDGATATDNITVTVNPAANQSPTANAGNNVTLTLPANSTTLRGSGSDPDGDIEDYRWARVSGPTTYTFEDDNTASTAVNGLVQGTYVFRLTVTDDDGATATDNVTVTVNPAANQSPTAHAGANVSITLPNNTTNLSGSGTDPDGTIESYRWSRVSGPTAYAFEDENAASTVLRGLIQGTYVFRLTVRDNDNATATDDITVAVNAAPLPPNQLPTANAGNDVNITLPVNSTTLQGGGADADGSVTRYAWTRVSGPTAYEFGNAGAASTTLTGLVQGTYVFRLTVTDNRGGADTDDLTVNVNAAPPANQPPNANAGNNITLTLPANSTTLRGSGTDPDGNVVSYAWTRVSGPAAHDFATPGSAVTILSGLVQGTYVCRLTVRDNDGATATDDVTITVNAAPPPPNQAPVARAGNDITITLPVNSTSLNGNGSTDPDGTIAGYAWSRVSGPTAYAFGNRNAVSTPLTGLVQGTYVFRLTVTDNDGATAIDNVTVTVNAAPPPPNQAPVANAGNDITLTLPANSTTLRGSGDDPDGNVVSYAWVRVSGPAAYEFDNANAASTALTGLAQGVYVFRLTVRDNKGGTDTDEVTVRVNAAPPPPPANLMPVARTSADIILYLPEDSVMLTGTSSTDPDGLITTYEWRQVDGPSQVTLANGRSSSVRLRNLMLGAYVFELKVTDNRGGSSKTTVRVTVKNKNNESLSCIVFPNPTRDNLHIQYIGNNTGKVKVSIYDANKRYVYGTYVTKSQVTLTETFNIARLSSGIYFIEIDLSGNKRMVKKFIKQ